MFQDCPDVVEPNGLLKASIVKYVYLRLHQACTVPYADKWDNVVRFMCSYANTQKRMDWLNNTSCIYMMSGVHTFCWKKIGWKGKRYLVSGGSNIITCY